MFLYYLKQLRRNLWVVDMVVLELALQDVMDVIIHVVEPVWILVITIVMMDVRADVLELVLVVVLAVVLAVAAMDVIVLAINLKMRATPKYIYKANTSLKHILARA